jgi:hypothetical protein
MLRELLSRVFSKKPVRRPVRRLKHCPLYLETLEHRWCPAGGVFHWTGGNGLTHGWNDSNQWTLFSGTAALGYPTANDEADFGSYSSGSCIVSGSSACAILSIGSAYTGYLDIQNGGVLTVEGNANKSGTCIVDVNGKTSLDSNGCSLIVENGGYLQFGSTAAANAEDVIWGSGDISCTDSTHGIPGGWIYFYGSDKFKVTQSNMTSGDLHLGSSVGVGFKLSSGSTVTDYANMWLSDPLDSTNMIGNLVVQDDGTGAVNIETSQGLDSNHISELLFQTPSATSSVGSLNGTVRDKLFNDGEIAVTKANPYCQLPIWNDSSVSDLEVQANFNVTGSRQYTGASFSDSIFESVAGGKINVNGSVTLTTSSNIEVMAGTLTGGPTTAGVLSVSGTVYIDGTDAIVGTDGVIWNLKETSGNFSMTSGSFEAVVQGHGTNCSLYEVANTGTFSLTGGTIVFSSSDGNTPNEPPAGWIVVKQDSGTLTLSGYTKSWPWTGDDVDVTVASVGGGSTVTVHS